MKRNYLAIVAVVFLIAGGTFIYSFRDTRLTKEETGKALEAAFDKLSKINGAKPVAPITQFLTDAVASGDKGEILRAFSDAVYSRNWFMRDVIPALKPFLNNPNPFVRYLAAQDLLIVGDNSGYSALISLVQSNSPIDGIGNDVRMNAAETLAQFRQTDATEDIFALYQQTNDGQLIYALEMLEADQAKAIDEAKGYYPEVPSMVHYGKVKANTFLPQITRAFQNSPKPDVKAAAAYALATMTGDQNAINYLIQTAQAGLNGSNQLAGVDERTLISYVGSIQSPAAKQTLETALNSADPYVVQGAIVYLIYNQGGSDKAMQVIVNQLNDAPNATMPWDFTLSMATQLLDDPQIQAAGQKFSRNDATALWWYYTVERKNWSIYNWVSGYVIKLNKEKQSDGANFIVTNTKSNVAKKQLVTELPKEGLIKKVPRLKNS